MELAGRAKWACFGNKIETATGEGGNVRIVFGNRCELDLDAVDTVDAVDEENQDEDEGDLQPVLQLRDEGVLGDEAEQDANDQFPPGTFQFRARSTYVNTRLLRENGIGTIRNMNSAISAIRSMNTCESWKLLARPLTTRTEQ